jgi:hypothetical protein
MPAKTVTCPHCGLAIKIDRSNFLYDVKEWRRVCKRPDLDPRLSLLLQRPVWSSSEKLWPTDMGSAGDCRDDLPLPIR